MSIAECRMMKLQKATTNAQSPLHHKPANCRARSPYRAVPAAGAAALGRMRTLPACFDSAVPFRLFRTAGRTVAKLTSMRFLIQ